MPVPKTFRSRVALLIGICLMMPLAGNADASGKPGRAEKMVMNLRYGNGSAGFYLLEAMRLSKEMDKDLRKALYQVREVDKSYAKSRGKPDSRFLEPAAIKIVQCQERSDQLSKELKDSFLELKESINQTLVSGAMEK